MKQIFITLSLILSLSSCVSEDNYKDFTEQNESEILAFIDEQNLNAEKTDSGLYYVIEDEGTGLQPTPYDKVTINYTGYFLDGEVFGESIEEGSILALPGLIYGLAEGIPLFKEGGAGKLIVPSRLAYGSNDYQGIPGGSVLAFNIELLSVNYSKENEEEITAYLAENDLISSAVETESGL